MPRRRERAVDELHGAPQGSAAGPSQEPTIPQRSPDTGNPVGSVNPLAPLIPPQPGLPPGPGEMRPPCAGRPQAPALPAHPAGPPLPTPPAPPRPQTQQPAAGGARTPEEDDMQPADPGPEHEPIWYHPLPPATPSE
eukprot:2773322-Prorocentrum_lima.AAC.1